MQLLKTQRGALASILTDTRTILCVALIIYLFWFISSAAWEDQKIRLVGNADPASYHVVSKIMLGASLTQIQKEYSVADIGLEIANRPIGYPLLLAVLYTIFGENPVAMVVLQMVLNLVGCWLVITAVRVINQSYIAGAIGGWAYALNPLLADYACHILTEVPFVALTAVLLYLLSGLHYGKPSQGLLTVFLIGIVVGAATLIRASMLYFALILGNYDYLVHSSYCKGATLQSRDLYTRAGANDSAMGCI